MENFLLVRSQGQEIKQEHPAILTASLSVFVATVQKAVAAPTEEAITRVPAILSRHDPAAGVDCLGMATEPVEIIQFYWNNVPTLRPDVPILRAQVDKKTEIYPPIDRTRFHQQAVQDDWKSN